MPRSSGGTYTLPGTPVVSGTPISSTEENALRSDVAAELTDSLSRSGKGEMTAPLELADGSVSLPALTFDSDTNTGLYSVAAGELGVAADGVKVLGATSTTVTLPKGLVVTQSTTNAIGIQTTGNGTEDGLRAIGGTGAAASGGGFQAGTGSDGEGAWAQGDGTGPGFYGTGGADGGKGGQFQGGATSGFGLIATGGAPDGPGGAFYGDGAGQGVAAHGGDNSGTGLTSEGGATNGKGAVVTGTGSGNGLEASTAAGTGYGAYLTGNTTRAPLILAPSVAPSAIDNGALYVNSSTGKLYVGFGGVWVLVGGQT